MTSLIFKGINPITYGILRFHQLRGGGGGGLFDPNPENKVTFIGSIWNLLPIMVRMILVNMQNLKLLTVILLEIWRHKNFQKGTSHRDSIFTPWNRAKLKKNHFLYLKTSFLAQNYTPLCISIVFKQNKNFICSIFREVSFQKQLQQPPGQSIVLKFCQNVSNR